MKSYSRVGKLTGNSVPKGLIALISLTVALGMFGCGIQMETPVELTSIERPARIDACTLVFSQTNGSDLIDQEISDWQEKSRSGANSLTAIERLGWAYVEKARQSYDAGYYRLAEQTAVCMDSKASVGPESLLLRGHALQSMHRFEEAETAARELVKLRGIPFDYGLLGDVLMDRGSLKEAIAAYQTMIDMRPDLQSYARAAHARWMTGDLEGATDLIRLATNSANTRDADSSAWVYTRLAMYELQAGNLNKAELACDEAIEFRKDYAPALLAKGRILLARNNAAAAIDPLKKAAGLDRLPEYQWALADALRTAGKLDEAAAVEAELEQTGTVEDPRTYSLYLATRGQKTDTARDLARSEIKKRGDVFSHDALAWALQSSGQAEKASGEIVTALSIGTKDARIYFHAGVIAAELGRRKEALRHLSEAKAIQQMLLPSEREILARRLAAL